MGRRGAWVEEVTLAFCGVADALIVFPMAFCSSRACICSTFQINRYVLSRWKGVLAPFLSGEKKTHSWQACMCAVSLCGGDK